MPGRPLYDARAMSIRRTILAWCAALVPPAALLARPAPAVAQDFEFAAEGGRRFDARIERPGPGDAQRVGPNGWSVMLIGGGSTTDMDWTIDGRFHDGREEKQLTIDGEPTRDAAAIARELLGRGYTVLRWSSIHKDDPKHATGAALADYQPFERTVIDTIAAFRAFEAHGGFERGKVILVAHSLGSARAAALIRSENGIAGLVSIAGSEIARLGYGNKELRDRVQTDLGAMDADRSGAANAEEFRAWAATYPDAVLPKMGFEALDFDADGALRDWELGAGLALARRAERDVTLLKPSLPGENPFLEDVLARTRTPAVFLSGSEDWLSRYAPVMKDRATKENLPRVIVKIMPGMNHQLAEVRDGRTGPMKPAAVKTIGAAAETIRLGFGPAIPEAAPPER